MHVQSQSNQLCHVCRTRNYQYRCPKCGRLICDSCSAPGMCKPCHSSIPPPPNPPDTTQYMPYPPATTLPHTRPEVPTPGLLIALMWVFQVFAFVVAAAEPAETDDLSWGLFFMTLIAAFVMAVVLVCRNNVAARANGWIVIGLDIMTFMLGLVAILAEVA